MSRCRWCQIKYDKWFALWFVELSFLGQFIFFQMPFHHIEMIWVINLITILLEIVSRHIIIIHCLILILEVWSMLKGMGLFFCRVNDDLLTHSDYLKQLQMTLTYNSMFHIFMFMFVSFSPCRLFICLKRTKPNVLP